MIQLRRYRRVTKVTSRRPELYFFAFSGILPHLRPFGLVMSFPALRFVLFCLALLGMGTISRAGMTLETPYTDKGQTDFDTALQLLNPYGTWSKIDGKWAFTPRDHLAPYTDGRWLYTEYGWYWKGSLPHSWATEHYGYWKRGADKAWSWYPGPIWLPQIVEFRATSGYIGWRSGEVDSDGNFVEAPIDRYSKPEEWTFVTLAQFANPITPDIVAKPDVAQVQLDESTDCRHTYLTYREIDRPGPHPADFADLCKDGGMLSPTLVRNDAAPTAPRPAPVIPGYTPSTNNAAAIMNGTNAPTLLGSQINPAADTRRVNYWITMSLPTFWTPRPAAAKSNEIYLYRPDFYQDDDGIARRITLWFNPKARSSLADIFGQNTTITSKPPTANAAPTGPDVPAVPASAEMDGTSNPFRSPLDDSSHPADAPSPRTTNGSSKNPVPSGPVPSGLASPDADAALPGTNAAPAK